LKRFFAVLSKILLSLMLIVITAAAALYIEGYYDFTFIDREKAFGSLLPGRENDPEQTGAYIDDFTQPRPVGDNLSLITHADSISDGSDTSEKPLLSDAAAAENNGWLVTGTDYDPMTHIVAERSYPGGVKNALNGRSYEVDVTSWATMNPVTEKARRTRKTLEPYMGWLLYDDGRTMSLMSPSGQVLMTEFDGVTPADLRDEYGRGLFSNNGNLYYITEDETGVLMNHSDYDPAFAPALRFRFPSDYGVAHSGLYIYYLDDPETGGRLYGYVNAAGEIVIEAKWRNAVNFSENGLACVSGDDRLLRIINTSGEIVYEETGEANRAGVRSDALYYYMWPFTDNEEQLGSLYFDRGYMMINEVWFERRQPDKMLGSQNLLLSEDGSLYDIPTGYSLAYYSDGVMVLTRDGKYGMMDILGNWIAQPIYTYVTPFYEGLAVIGFNDGSGRKCMVDTKGNIVLPFYYNHISISSGGVIAAYETQNGWHILNKMAKPAE
jgi:hypothetical protein